MPSFSETLQVGNTIASLEALRDAIAADLEVCEAMRDRASLYLRLADILNRIDDLKPAVSEGDAVDEIAARRSARRSSSTKNPARARRPG